MTEATATIELSGLGAQDPLAYLASLGCLLALSAGCQRAGLAQPTMRFGVGGALTPIMQAPLADAEALLDMLVADLDEIAGRDEDGIRDCFLTFDYPDDAGNVVRDLKPPPKVFRKFAQKLIDGASPVERRTIDWAAASLTDVAVDRSKGAGKPFALHFTAGNQRFLNIALELLDGTGTKQSSRPVDRDDLRAAVLGPWMNDRDLKVFSWSPTQDRAYALRAVDPSGDQKLGNPGADWLALRGIGLLSSAPVGAKIETSGVRGGWKTGTFSYPIWPDPLDEYGVRALLRHPAVRGDDPATNEGRWSVTRTLPRGVEVLTCRISRSDQGGYGAFSRPSRR